MLACPAAPLVLIHCLDPNPSAACRLCSAAQRGSSRQLARRGRLALSTVAGEVATEQQQQQQPKQQKQKQQQKQQQGGGGKKGERLVTPKSEDFSRCAAARLLHVWGGSVCRDVARSPCCCMPGLLPAPGHATAAEVPRLPRTAHRAC